MIKMVVRMAGGGTWARESPNTNDFIKQGRAILVIVIMSILIGFVLFSIWNLSHSLPDTERHFVILNPKQSVFRTTSSMFLSFGLDSSLLRQMEKLPISVEKFINLATHLSPAFFRFGGTDANCLFFNKTVAKRPKSHVISSPYIIDISNFTITGEDFLSLYRFTKKSGNRMLFDLNVLIRKADGSWNESNAREIIEFAKSHGMTLDWQLGYETNSFLHIFGVEVTAQQLAKDYKDLRHLLDSLGYGGSILIGPEVNYIGDSEYPFHRGENYVKEFLMSDKNTVDFVTFHQYSLNDREAEVQDFINPDVFNKLSNQIKAIQNAVNAAGKKTPIWMSETSTAFGGGAPELSDRFVAGFLFLDKLGYSASSGLQVVIRQSFFGGNYAMVGSDLTPNPDWWISVVYNEFVSNKVLNLVTENNFGKVRLYAHCTREKSLLNRVPAVTLYGMNLFEYSVKLLIQGIGLTSKNVIFLYALTADKLESRMIKMNGETLKLLPNGNLPPFKPVILEAGDLITLPAYSMVFVVMHGVNISACTT